MIRKGALVIAAIIVVIAITVGLYASGMDDQITIGGGRGGINSNIAEVVIKSDVAWSADIKDSESRSHLVDGFGDRTIPIVCNSDGTYSLTVQKSEGISAGTLNVEVVKKESGSQRSSTTSANGIISLSGTC
ncbi:MAG: hypothetical protein M3275_07045 [Thermoproteota archaeon]|nr:hypothetical protein [Thermoproteota archaeon]